MFSLYISFSHTQTSTHTLSFSHTHKRTHTNALTHSLTHSHTHTKVSITQNSTQHLDISQSAHRHNCKMLVIWQNWLKLDRSLDSRTSKVLHSAWESRLKVGIQLKIIRFWCHQFKINFLTVQPISLLSSSWAHFFNPKHLLYVQQVSNCKVGVLQVLDDFLLN